MTNLDTTLAATSAVPMRLLGQRFLLKEQIGAGGMGTVFRASDEQTGQAVAIKFLQAHGTPQEALRFAREAQLLAELRHPHIVSYLADGIDEAGHPYLAMEWLEGEDLAQCLRHRQLSLSECVELLLGASAGLAESHRRGIVHRDLKPGNLFLRSGDPARVVLLDFGIARRTRHGAALTGTGVVIGTPEYMAPEQARGERDIGQPADIFSLGCVLYECLTGRPAFAGEHVAAVLIKVLLEEAPSVESFRPDLPAAFSDLLKRMLRKDPRERFPNALALHDALRRLELPLDSSVGALRPTLPAGGALTPQEHQIFSVAVAIPRSSDATKDSLPPLKRDSEQALLKAVQAEVSKLGARVEHLGDGTIVATVLPAASVSDQVTLASRCALLLAERLPNAAVAVATGRGLLHGQVPIGEVVDRALGLLEKSPSAPPAAGGPGRSVLLDELTENLLSGRFELAHDGGATRLLREVNPTTRDDVRKLLGQPTPCVGRELELGILESTLSSCIDESIARAVAVVASPGLGKSRLRHEFLRGSRARHPQIVELMGRGDMNSAGVAYGILGQALRRHCGLVGDEPTLVAQQRLRERLGRQLKSVAAGRIVSFVGELCGVHFPVDEDPVLRTARSDPKVMHDQVTQAFLEWLRAECQAAPVLLVLEDLHWGDALTVSLLTRALRELAELPLFMLALARPEVHDLFPAFFSNSCVQELLLRPLSRRAGERLAHVVLRRALGNEVDAESVARLVGQSAGNPLFLEELIRSLAEGRQENLPETVWAMLVGRLSQLDPAVRQTLRAASVFGQTFPRAGVVALLGEDWAGTFLDGTLELLLREELIERPREGREAGAERYMFRHALVCETAYSLLTEENLVAAHRLTGSYLEQTGDATSAVLAEHARKGQDFTRAAGFYIKATREALACHDLDATLRLAEQAFKCGVQSDQAGVVRAMQAQASYLRLDLAVAYDYAIAAVDSLTPGNFWWCKAIGVCFYAIFMVGRLDDMERLVPAFFAATPDCAARGAYLEAGSALSTLFMVGGMRGATESLVQKLTPLAAALDPLDRAYLVYTTGFQACDLQPDPYRGVVDGQQALTLFRNQGDREGETMSLFCVGMSYRALGAFEKSEAALREGRALAIATHNVFYAGVIHLHLGFVLADQPIAAKQEEARSIGEAFAAQPQLGPAIRGAAHKILAQVRLAAGELETVEPIVQIALESFARMLPYRMLTIPLQVELLLKQGRASEARPAAESAVRLIDEQGGLGYCEVPVRLALARACLADGDAVAGRSALGEALAQVKLRADKITDPELRESYLNMPENQQIFVLARVKTAG